ncbi:TetR/AcrR family transcriptional regulator [Breoghania sp. L-A4]|uniref:TetR/AcrR family transcriptional regulator n=1 Tax=Breoghania sp. L-A4 TaxID=2304600 RepID=UPI000E35DB16|nr:TetR/AcrR family transcriptional regulator [Breoghania sp. L-A4]AXS39139.1 TetR/AcrR family transcriptional regulator [Breoghania sp. L-A4]
MPQYKRTASTRDRLLQAACEIFSIKGFRDTTVADICDVAQANIAAVNYHFGNKEKLYREVWSQVLKTYEEGGAATPPRSEIAADDLLYGYVVDRLTWLLGGDQLERLIRFEVTQPSGHVDDLRDAALRSTQQHFLDVIQRIAGGGLSPDNVQLCCTSIVSQCRALMMLSQLDHRSEEGYVVPGAKIRAFARHVTTFSIAGIKALAEHESAGAER